MHVLRKRYGPDRNLIKCLVEGDQNHGDKIWLPLELFVELLDRQRDSFVGTKFLHSSTVDRRLQLYALAESGTCEQRSISSLDSEAMFVNFQDVDQNGFSVLRADDIPSAPMTTVCIFAYTLNQQGGFAMNTCQNDPVEHFHKVTKRNDYLISARVYMMTRLICHSTAYAKDRILMFQHMPRLCLFVDLQTMVE